MKKTIADLKEIIRLGGGMNLDANVYTVSELKDFVKLAEVSGATINIRNTEYLAVYDLKILARLGGGKVIFEF
jgi:hypothetical protein